MTDTTEQKALTLVNEVLAEGGCGPLNELDEAYYPELRKALCRTIEELEAEKAARAADREQHEAFRQEVSDAVEEVTQRQGKLQSLLRFIIAKPDPLVEIVDEVARDLHITGASTLHTFRSDDFRNALREALAKRGGKIVWGEG